MRILKMFIFVLITAYSFSPWAGDLEPDKVGQKRVRESNPDQPNAKKPVKSLDQYCFDGNLEGVKSWLKILSIEGNKENFIHEQALTIVDSLNRGLRNFLSGWEQDETTKKAKIRDFSLIALLLIVNDIESRFPPEIEFELKKMLAEVAESKNPWKDLNLPRSICDYLIPERLTAFIEGKIEKGVVGVIRCIILFLKKYDLPYQEELDKLLQFYVTGDNSQNLYAVVLMLELGANPKDIETAMSLPEDSYCGRYRHSNLTKKQIIFLLSRYYGAATNNQKYQDKVNKVINEITHNIPGWESTSNYKIQSLNYLSKLIENTTILEVETLALIKACNKDKPQDNPEEFTRIFDRVKTLLDPAFYSSFGWLNFYSALLWYAPTFDNFPQTADVTKFICKNFPDDAFKIFLAALCLKNFDMAQLLIDSGVIIDSNLGFPSSDLEVLLNFQKIKIHWYLHKTLLHFAMENNYFWWVEFLAKNNFDVNSRANGGKTPLHIACQANNFDSVKTLIANHANPNIIDCGFTPIMLTTDLAILEFLKTKKAPFVKKDSKFKMLKWPCQKSDLKVLQFWKGYGYHFKNSSNKTLFQFAIQQGWVKDEQTFQALLELSGESVNHQDKGGSSALMNACYNRNINVVEWLIKAGADLDLTQKSQKFSALHYAGPTPKGCRSNGYDKQIIALLVANNAHVAGDLKEDKNFGTILQLKNQLLQAISDNNIIEVKYVLSQEIGPQLALSKDITGKHALAIATDLGYEEIVQLLLDANPQKPKIPVKSARK